MGKKTLLARILFGTGLISVILWINKYLCRRLVILAYHRVLDLHGLSDDEYASDVELVSASCADFEWQVKFLSRHFPVTTFGDYANKARSGDIRGNLAIITFDDGFKDNYANAFPILKKHNTPAVFFVSVDYLDTGKRFWFEFLVSVIKQLPEVHFGKIVRLLSVSAEGQDRMAYAEKVLDYMKHVSNDTRLEMIEAVYRYCEENNITVVDPESRAMSWEDVREMSASGMEIGSHTLSHPILSRLSNDEIWSEVDESRKVIEARTGEECNSLAYPNGGAEDMNEAVYEAVGRSGYQYACSYIPGINIHGKLSVYSLKRLHVERYTGKAEFAAMLALPGLFGG